MDAELLKNKQLALDDLDDLAPKFEQFFTTLHKVMQIQEQKQLASDERSAKEAEAKQQTESAQVQTTCTVVPSPTSSIITRSKRPPPPDPLYIGNTSKRAKGNSPSPSAPPKTPDQPTLPADPTKTSSSIESQEEEASKELLALFLSCSLSVLKSKFRELKWQQSGAKVVELVRTYLPSRAEN